MIWRSGRGLHDKSSTAVQGKDSKRGRTHGVAKVLATEPMLDENGRHPRAIVWCIYGGYLIRCAPEQLQYASERQRILAELDQPTEMPWTFDRLTQRLLPGSFLDIVPEAGEVPDSEDEVGEPLLKRTRLRAKQAPPPAWALPPSGEPVNASEDAAAGDREPLLPLPAPAASNSITTPCNKNI